MLRRLQPVLLMAAVAVVFFFCGAKVETWFERPASAGTLVAAKLPAGPAIAAKTAPAPAVEAAGTPAPAVESGVDPETQVEFYQVKDLPEIAGQGQDVDMIDEPAAANEPAAEAEAAPAASDAPNPPLGH